MSELFPTDPQSSSPAPEPDPVPAGATPVPIESPTATQVASFADDPVVAAFQRFREWFLNAERTLQPRLCIDRTIEKLGELCGDPPVGS